MDGEDTWDWNAGPLSVGPSVLTSCLPLEAGPPRSAHLVWRGGPVVGVTGLGSLGGRESRHSAVRRHTAWGQPAARGCGVRLVWPQTNELPDLSPPVPVAQEWSADLNRTLSRKEKKKNADGVTLMGINQTGDQASQNKPSRWALGTSVPGKAPSPLPGLECPYPGRLPKGALQGTPGHLSRCSAGQQPRASLGRIFISLSARAAERSGEGAFATAHFGPLVTERTDAGLSIAHTQQCTRAGGGDWGRPSRGVRDLGQVCTYFPVP